MGIVVHHTASSTSTAGDCNYMWNSTSGDQPIGAIYLARDGEIVVGAAGATNCAGKGGPYTTSKGTIPLDSGNSNTISIEAANNGTGEQWPTAQQDAYVALVAALCSYYGFDPLRDVMAHFEWAPDRKIDPAGNSRYASGAAKWNMGKFRGDVKAKMGSPTPTPIPEPQPPPEEDEDMHYIAQRTTDGAVALVSHGGGGVTFMWIATMDDINAYRSLGIQTIPVSAAQFDMLLNATDYVDIIGDNLGAV